MYAGCDQKYLKKNGEHVFVAKETCQDAIYMLGPKPSDHNLTQYGVSKTDDCRLEFLDTSQTPCNPKLPSY